MTIYFAGWVNTASGKVHSSPPWSQGVKHVNELWNALCAHLQMIVHGFSIELYTVKDAVTILSLLITSYMGKQRLLSEKGDRLILHACGLLLCGCMHDVCAV